MKDACIGNIFLPDTQNHTPASARHINPDYQIKNGLFSPPALICQHPSREYDTL